jgi:hypothetical protein
MPVSRASSDARVAGWTAPCSRSAGFQPEIVPTCAVTFGGHAYCWGINYRP